MFLTPSWGVGQTPFFSVSLDPGAGTVSSCPWAPGCGQERAAQPRACAEARTCAEGQGRWTAVPHAGLSCSRNEQICDDDKSSGWVDPVRMRMGSRPPNPRSFGPAGKSVVSRNQAERSK